MEICVQIIQCNHHGAQYLHIISVPCLLSWIDIDPNIHYEVKLLFLIKLQMCNRLSLGMDK